MASADIFPPIPAKGSGGTGAIKTISEQLRKELPGLKGFSESNLKNMRLFYEEWHPVISNSTIQTNESPAVAGEIETRLLLPTKSPTMAGDLETFLNLSFSHHIEILTGEKTKKRRRKEMEVHKAYYSE